MPHQATHQIAIPQTDLLTYLFLQDAENGHQPLWYSASNPACRLTKAEALLWIKRLAIGLKALGIKRGDRVMLLSPNHIFVPIVYLGIIGSGAIFTGASSASTSSGEGPI